VEGHRAVRLAVDELADARVLIHVEALGVPWAITWPSAIT
jgi:hypothetical protein